MRKLYSATVLLSALLSASAFAGTVENWNSSKINGYTRYWTTNRGGANFIVWCHPTRPFNGTLLQIEIDGKTPPPESRIKVVLDKDIFELPVNKHGYIGSDCATCADSFDYVWHRLRSSSSVAVKFTDERYALFSLKGANAVLPGAACPTDWRKSHPGT